MTDTADYAREYGSRVRGARIAADLTQADLAKALGCTQAQISRIESGARTHTAEELLQVANTTSCDPRWLLTGWEPGHGFQGAPLARQLLAGHVRELRQLADQLEHALPGLALPEDPRPAAPPPLCAPNPTLETR